MAAFALVGQHVPSKARIHSARCAVLTPHAVADVCLHTPAAAMKRSGKSPRQAVTFLGPRPGEGVTFDWKAVPRMPISKEAAQARGRIGGYTRAALAPDRDSITRAARDARWQRYLDQVPPEITDPAERTRRAELLRRADMTRLSLKAAKARRLRAQARALEAEIRDGELDADGQQQIA